MSSRHRAIFALARRRDAGAVRSPAGGTPERPGEGDNGAVGRAVRFATSPRGRLVLALLLVCEGLAETLTRGGAGHLGAETTLAIVLLALGSTLPVVFLGAASAALLTCAASVLSLAAFHVLSVASGATGLLALYRLGHTRFAKACGGPVTLPFLVLALVGSRGAGSYTAGLTVVLAVLAPAALLGGIAARARAEAAENRAARELITDTLIEHTARSERARIARELHDVVAHHISMVAVQAESARLAVPGLPAAGAQRFAAIGDTARAALVEMRRLLGVLREDARLGAVERHPQPGLDQVTQLIDDAREASGAAARLIVSGTPMRLDPNVELVAYRIVQEALTNARRHAPGAAVDVELSYGDGELRLRIRDNGPGPAAPTTGGGHGVAGMRERASAVGGRVRTSAAAGGGYLVETVLPAKVEGRL